jgi:hypothetical protein
MSPFIAAFVACCAFASFIVVFGVLLPGRHPNGTPVALREARSRAGSGHEGEQRAGC